MRANLEYQTPLGALIWIGLIAVGIIFARKSIQTAPIASQQIANYIGSQQSRVTVKLPSQQLLRVGDPVFLHGSDRVSPIGVVSKLTIPPQYGVEAPSDDSTLNRMKRWVGLADIDEDTYKLLYWVTEAEITLFGSAPELSEEDFLEYNSSEDSAAWVVQTMFHEKKREEIGELLMDSFRKNQEDIVAALKPVIQDSLQDASEIIKEDIKKAFVAREEQVKKIGQRYQDQLVEKELLPLVKDEIWPIVQDESQPLAAQVGQEIWNEVSVFRFGWRYLYDKTPLPDRKLTEKEFKRFVDSKAIPILESHLGDFVEVQKSIIQKISANEKVKKTFSESVKKIANDPEIQQLLLEVFKEVFVDNDRLQNAIRERWNGPAAKQALSLANRRLEPTIREIGVLLFGTPTEQITPEFAQVLRHRILHKDSRWLMLHHDPNAPVTKQVEILGKINTEHSVPPYAPARDR